MTQQKFHINDGPNVLGLVAALIHPEVTITFTTNKHEGATTAPAKRYSYHVDGLKRLDTSLRYWQLEGIMITSPYQGHKLFVATYNSHTRKGDIEITEL